MKKVIFSFTLLFTLAIQAQSQVSAKKEKIKSLFALMEQDSLMIKTMDAMSSSMVNSMTKIFEDTSYTNHGIDASRITQKFMEKSMAKSKEMALKLLNNDMVDIYDKYFTIENISDFNTFYASKSGQAMLHKIPDITKDLMSVMMSKYQQEFQQSLIKDMKEITDELDAQVKLTRK